MYTTVEPLLMDTLYKGHNRINLGTGLMVTNEEFHILTIHFEPLKRGQPLYKEKNVWSQGVLYIEVPLYYYNGY